MTRSFLFVPRASRVARRRLATRPIRRGPRRLTLDTLLVFEPLEQRTLLSSATLDISNSGSTKGLLSYNPSGTVASDLSIKASTQVTDPVQGFSKLIYTVTDASEPITLGSGATADGWTGSGTNTVTGPGSIKTLTNTTYVSSVDLNMLAGNDSVTVASVGAPVNLSFTNHAGDADSVLIGGPGGAQNITGNITIANAQGSTALTVDDAGDSKPQTVFLSDGQLANIEPYLILFGSADLSSLTIDGAGALGTLNVNAGDQGPVSVVGGPTTGSGTISIGSNAPIVYSSFLAVNINDVADLPLTQVSQTISTSTGDVPVEGKAFSYITTTFAYPNPQAKTSNFVATINWGDGTLPVAGSITADGIGQYQASAMHTFEFAGTYSVVTTITDIATTTDSYTYAGIPVTVTYVPSSAVTTGSVAQVNLVSNTPSIPAEITDPNLVNPWGIAGDAGGFAWVADEGSGVATYEGPGGSTPVGTSVVIPPASGVGTGSPAGIVYNGTSDFSIGGQPTEFLFATLDGTISGWNGLSPAAAIAVNNSSLGAVYTGLTIAADAGQNLLYVANFKSGMIEVYNSSFTLVNEFTDPNVPAGFAPYNIADLGGTLYVAFAQRNSTGTAAVSQLGDGFVDEFTPGGALIQELIVRAPLDAPWGLALAPASFGQFGGDLLVANQGNGQVDAFNPASGQFLGAFPDSTGAPIVNDGLHGLFVSPTDSLYFTAGLNGGADGLFGSLTPTPPSVAVTPATLSATITNVSAVEGLPFVGVVTTFTDANIYASAADFTALVQWGDSTSDTSGDGNVTLTQTNGPGSSYLITGTHVYTTPTTGFPPYVLLVTIYETDGGSSVLNTVYAQGTATVADAPLYPYNQDQDLVADGIFGPAIEGEEASGVVAQFTDADPLTWPDTDEFSGSFAPVITWGDGKTSLGTVDADAATGVFDVMGTHTYASPTPDGIPNTVSVAVTDAFGSKTTVTNYIPVADGEIDLSGLDLSTNDAIPVQEGKSYSGDVATFTFSNPNATANSFMATIDWGDSSSVDAGTIKEDGDGVYHVSGTHTYLEGDTDGNGGDPYTITVTVLELVGSTLAGDPNQVSVDSTATVWDSPIQYTPPNAPVTMGVLAGTTTVETLNTDDDFTIRLGTLVDTNPNSQISDFTSITIDWGDGSVLDTTTGTLMQTTMTPAPSGTIGINYAVFGTHSFDDEGSFLATVTIDDSDGSETSDSLVITVPTPPPPPPKPVTIINLRAIAIAANLTVNRPFTVVVAQFTAVNLNVSITTCFCCYFGSLIYWGDGSPGGPGQIEPGPNDANGNPTFYVEGTYTYAAAGSYSFSVTVSAPGTTPVTTSTPGTANVYGEPLDAESAPISGTQGQPLPSSTVVATFIDPIPVSDPTSFAQSTQVTVNWGDGTSDDDAVVTPVTGSSVNAGTVFVVTDSHTYQNITDVFQAFQVTVSILPPDDTAAVVTDLAQMGIPVLTDAALAVPAVMGSAFTTPVATIHTSDDESAADFGASINWGDGDVSSGTLEPDGPNTLEVLGTHTYSSTGSFPMAITLTDAQGNTVTNSRTAVVTPPPAPSAVPLTAVQTISNPHNQVVELALSFSGLIDPTDAGQTGSYRLVMAGKGGSFTAPSARTIKIRSAAYDAANHSVLLKTTKPFSLSKPVELLLDGQSRAVVPASEVRAKGAGARPAVATGQPALHAEAQPPHTPVRRATDVRLAPHSSHVDALLANHALLGVGHSRPTTNHFALRTR
jgi:uncharacterized protein (TIGR03118 family)